MYTLRSLKPVQRFVFPATVTFSSYNPAKTCFCTKYTVVISVYDDTNFTFDNKKTAKNTLLKV